MTSIIERYDRDAEDYERYWAPVLDRAAREFENAVAIFVKTESLEPAQFPAFLVRRL